MLTPDQNPQDFPIWILPYINIARLSETAVLKQVESLEARIPEMAYHVHVMAITSALNMRKVASYMQGDLQKQFTTAANRALTVAIEDCGNTGNKPWPVPPKQVFLREIAVRLAVASIEVQGDEVLHTGFKEVVNTLSKQFERG